MGIGPDGGLLYRGAIVANSGGKVTEPWYFIDKGDLGMKSCQKVEKLTHRLILF